MQKVVPASVDEAKDFFSRAMETAANRRRLKFQPHSLDYLAQMLVSYMNSEKFFRRNDDGKLEENVLAYLYGEYLQADPALGQVKLRRMGDVCLLVTGLFPDSIKRKIVDVDYYFGMGGTAYGMLSDMHFSSLMRDVFGELSEKFKEVSVVLGEISDTGGFQSNSDLLALYERWVATGDDRLGDRLRDHGITPIPVKNKKPQ